MTGSLLVFSVLAVVVIITIIKTAVIVPQQNAYVVERLGKFHSTLRAGFHVLLPFVDTVRYRHSLKELAMDIPEQICITPGQCAGGGGWGALHEDHGSPAGLLRCRQLHLCHHSTGSDHAA